MGMAASQARLLTITARIHDIEYKAQCLQNAKILLSQLEDEAYQKFLAAQDGANIITIKANGLGSINMNASTMAELLGYGLLDNNGSARIPQYILDKYESSGGTPDSFVRAMMGVSDDKDISNNGLYDTYSKLYSWISQYYPNIQGIDSAHASDTSWLAERIAGGWSIGGLDKREVNENMFIVADPGADFYYQVNTEKDNTQIAKASAEYENTLKKIDRKDKMYDMELSKLESERNALTTEYDSLKKVISDNIERTFGIFS